MYVLTLLVFKKYIITAYPLNLMSHCLFYFVCIFTILSSIFGSDSSYAHAYIHITHTHTHTHTHKGSQTPKSWYWICPVCTLL